MRLAPPEARCLTCGYCLAWLRTCKCPECGRDFDPNDASSYGMPARLGHGARQRVTSAVHWAIAKPLNATPRAASGWLLAAGLCLTIWQVSVLMGVMAAAVGVAVVFLTLKDAMLGRTGPRRFRRAAALSVVPTLLLNIGFDRCPHATYVSIGFVTYAVSGKQCGNPRHPVALLNLLTGIENPWA
jgi:hypothetical protein